MKSLKPLIFAAHTELKPTLTAIKKSHLYEAFASFCGFKSYAAFQAATVINVDDIELAKRQCFDRMQPIGFDAASALLISQYMEKIWRQYDVISLDEVYRFYSTGAFEESDPQTHILDALTELVASGDAEALLVGLVVTTQFLAEYDEDPDNRSGEYWHNKITANHQVKPFQYEVAKRYQTITPYRELFKLLLSKLKSENSEQMPSPKCLKEIDGQFYSDNHRCWSGYFADEPHLVLEAITFASDYLGEDAPGIPMFVYLDWLKAEMIESPIREYLIEIIEASKDGDEKWFWHFVGLQHGIDVTQSNLRAIHAYTGEDYDDYGPMDVVGDEGLTLPVISSEIKVKLESEAIRVLPK